MTGSTVRRWRSALISCGALLVAVAATIGFLVIRDTDELATDPGSTLAAGGECAETIERSGWEPVPANAEANQRVPSDVEIPARTDYAPEAATEVFPRIDGAFTGTTDEIIEWAACKWGFDPDLVRAQAFVESSWVQSATGDTTDNPEQCVSGETPPCPTSFGLLQIKHLFHPGSYPHSRESTAFNVDYGLGLLRACYEGWVSYFPDDYAAGNLEGCIGHHFSGRWRDDDGVRYANRVLDVWRTEGWKSLPGVADSLHGDRPSRSSDTGAGPLAD